MNDEERFWEKVKIGGSDDCWTWTGSINKPHKYGRFWYKDKLIGAHVFSYMINTGAVLSRAEIFDSDQASCV